MQIADRFVERIGELEVGQGVVVRTRSGTVHRGRAAGLTSGDYLDGTDDATILRSARLAMLRGEHRVIDTARGHLLLYPVILASGEVVATVGMALEREMYGGVEALPDSWERLLRQQLKLWVDQVIREVAEARRQRLPVGAGSRPAPGRGPRGTDLPGRRNELSGHIDDVEAGARMGIEASFGLAWMNRSARDLAEVSGHPSTCYEALGRAKPCEPCVARQALAAGGEARGRVEAHGRFYDVVARVSEGRVQFIEELEDATPQVMEEILERSRVAMAAWAKSQETALPLGSSRRARRAGQPGSSVAGQGGEGEVGGGRETPGVGTTDTRDVGTSAAPEIRATAGKGGKPERASSLERTLNWVTIIWGSLLIGISTWLAWPRIEGAWEASSQWAVEAWALLPDAPQWPESVSAGETEQGRDEGAGGPAAGPAPEPGSAPEAAGHARGVEGSETAPDDAPDPGTLGGREPLATPQGAPAADAVEGSETGIGGEDLRALVLDGRVEEAAQGWQAQFDGAAPGHYTLPLVSVCRDAGVLRNLRRFSGGDPVAVLPVTIRGEACYMVTHGVYATAALAMQALDGLPRAYDRGRVAPHRIGRLPRR